MSNDLEKPTESSEQKAKRKWLNQKLRQDYKSGNTPVPMMVNPKDIDYVNGKVRVDKNPPPEVATVVANKAKRLRGGFERKFIKELREMLDERKQIHLEMVIANLKHQRRRLMLEKLRRMELRIAQEEAILAQRQKHEDEGQSDLFAIKPVSKDLFA